MCCALRDCGRRQCRVCSWARIPSGISASTAEPMREDAKPDLPEKRKPSMTMPKKRHRVGPHA